MHDQIQEENQTLKRYQCRNPLVISFYFTFAFLINYSNSGYPLSIKIDGITLRRMEI